MMVSSKLKVRAITIYLPLAVFLFNLTACRNAAEPAPDSFERVDGDDNNPPAPGISVYAHVRVQWAPTDYREIFYDAAKAPVRAVRENLFIEGSNVTKKVEYNFLYDQNGLLKQVTTDNGMYVDYIYEGSQVQSTKEFAPDNRLLTTRSYVYSGDKLAAVIKTDAKTGANNEERYYYDVRGNLSEIREYAQGKDSGQFETYRATRFSEFDNQKNVDNLWTIYPFLPATSFGDHNFSKISYFYYDGKGLTETHASRNFLHQYDSNGYPVARIETGAGLSLTSSYSYVNF